MQCERACGEPRGEERPPAGLRGRGTLRSGYSHILFDLDGTLSASEPGIVASLVEALEAHGLAVPPPDVLRTAIGPPFGEGLPALGVPPELLEPVTAHYRKVYNDGDRLFETSRYDGVAEMLDALGAAGLVLGVATSKPERAAERVLDFLGIADRFTAVAGADLETGRKDKAGVITRALDLLAVSADSAPSQVVMVGDRRHDIEGAHHHGIDTIAVTWGYGDAAEHAAAGATHTAATPIDVVGLLLD